MPFWERALATFMGDPTTVIGVGLVALAAGWWIRGERVQILKDQLSQAQRDADTFSERLVRAEAKFVELQIQISAHAAPAQIEGPPIQTIRIGTLRRYLAG